MKRIAVSQLCVDKHGDMSNRLWQIAQARVEVAAESEAPRPQLASGKQAWEERARATLAILAPSYTPSFHARICHAEGTAAELRTRLYQSVLPSDGVRHLLRLEHYEAMPDTFETFTTLARKCLRCGASFTWGGTPGRAVECPADGGHAAHTADPVVVQAYRLLKGSDTQRLMYSDVAPSCRLIRTNFARALVCLVPCEGIPALRGQREAPLHFYATWRNLFDAPLLALDRQRTFVDVVSLYFDYFVHQFNPFAWRGGSSNTTADETWHPASHTDVTTPLRPGTPTELVHAQLLENEADATKARMSFHDLLTHLEGKHDLPVFLPFAVYRTVILE